MKIRDWRTGGGYLRGIDVSSYQGTINFAKVKSNGIKFAILRAYGTGTGGNGDTRMKEYADGFKSVGIPCGSYFFCTISNEYDLNSARTQANMYATKLESVFGVGSWGQLTPFIDLEDNSNVGGIHTSLNTTGMINWVKEFRKTFEARFQNRVKLGIYTSWYFINDHNNFNNGALADMPLWMAKWRTTSIKDVGGWTNWVLWQYTDDAQPFANGQTVGVSSTGLDMNYCESLDDLMYEQPIEASTPKATLQGNNSIAVNWVKPSLTSVTKVELYRNDILIATLDRTADSFIDNKTAYKSFYKYHIVVYTSYDKKQSEKSNEVATMMKRADKPTGLVTQAFDREIRLTWNPNPIGDEVTGYSIIVDGTKTGFTKETSFVLSGLTEGRTYNFQIQALNEHPIPSDVSDVALGIPIKVSPNAPTNLLTDITGLKEVILTWDYTPKEKFSHFDVIVDDKIVISRLTDKTTTIKGLSMNVDHTFKVVAYDTDGDSTDSVITTKRFHEPAKVTGLTGTPLDRRIQLSWNPVAFTFANEPDITLKSYMIYNDGFLVATVDGTINSFLVENLENGNEYTYTIQALSSQDIKGSLSDPITIAPIIDYPNKATNLNAIIEDRTTILFTWEHIPTENFEYFDVLINDRPVATDTTVKEYRYLQARENFDYKLEIIAYDIQGDSVTSGVFSTRIDIPQMPVNLKAVPKDRETILTWDSNPEPFVEKYNVFVNNELYSSVNAPLTTLKVTGLVNDVMYSFQVEAVGFNGFNSERTDFVTATTKLDIPNKPKFFMQREIGNGGVELHWEHQQKEYHSHYNIYKDGFLYAENIEEKYFQTDYLQTNTTHSFQVQAFDIQGDRSGFSESEFVTIYAKILEPLSVQLGKIDENLEVVKPKLFLCKPNKQTIAKLGEAYAIIYNTRYADLNEITFNIPATVEINKELTKNTNFDKIRERYLIRLELGNNIEYFIINQISNTSENNAKTIHAWSLGYELKDKLINNLKEEIYTAHSAFQLALDGVVNWNIGANIKNSDFYWNQESRIFAVSNQTVLDFIIQIATSFNAVLVWDTVNRIVDFSNPTIQDENKGLKIKYGKYLKSLSKTSSIEEMVTQLRPIGENNLSIREVTVNGSDYLEDFSFFMQGFDVESDDFADFYLNSKAVVVNPLDAYYTETMGFSTVPKGALFLTINPTTGRVSDTINIDTMARAIVAMLKMHHSTNGYVYLERARLFVDFILSQKISASIEDKDFFVLPTNIIYNRTTNEWIAQKDKINVQTLYAVTYALLEMYDEEAKAEYLELIESLTSFLGYIFNHLNARVTSNDITSGFEGLIYDSIATEGTREDGRVLYRITQHNFDNTTLFFLGKAWNKYKEIFGNPVRADLLGNAYTPQQILDTTGNFFKQEYTSGRILMTPNGLPYTNYYYNPPISPVAVNETYTVNEDGVLTIDSLNGVLKNDYDEDSETFEAFLVNTTANGSLTFNSDGSFTYTPNPNFSGNDMFTYRLTDGRLESNLGIVNITVNEIGDPPIAKNFTFYTKEDSLLTMDVTKGLLNTAIDVDSPILTAILVTPPTKGTLNLNEDGSFNYTPIANFYGIDSFTYKISDGVLESNVATVTINISDVLETQPTGTFSYTVVSGETLSAIAVRYETTVDTIVSLNALPSASNIYGGQKLWIPIPPKAPNLPTNITPANGATQTNLNVSAILTDDDSNLVKMIVQYSLNAGFTGTVYTKESDFIPSGTRATVTLDKIAKDTTFYIKIKSYDGNKYSTEITQSFFYDDPQPVGTVPYTVVAGDTFGKIAIAYNTTVYALQTFNPTVAPEALWVGQQIYVPQTIKYAQILYLVKSGETASLIASNYQTDLDTLQKLNPNVDLNVLQVNQWLYVPKIPPTGAKVYIVVSGDTYSAIATKHNTTITKLQELNPTQDPNLINVGQVLYVPVATYTILSETDLNYKSIQFVSETFETSPDKFPDSFGRTAGNFDGAGMSWGIIQYNWKSQTVQPIFKDLINNYPTVVRGAITNQADYDYFKNVVFNKTVTEQIAFGNSITDTTNKHKVKEPWNTYFRNLGLTKESQDRQMVATGWYLSEGKKYFNQLGLWSRRGYALCVDIAVQAGSMNPVKNGVVVDVIGQCLTAFQNIVTTGKTAGQIEVEKLVIIANKRSDQIDSSWQASFRERKLSIANGGGWIWNNGVYVDVAKYNLVLEPAFATNIPPNYTTEMAEEFYIDTDDYTMEMAGEITPDLTTATTVVAEPFIPIPKNYNINTGLLDATWFKSENVLKIAIGYEELNHSDVATNFRNKIFNLKSATYFANEEIVFFDRYTMEGVGGVAGDISKSLVSTGLFSQLDESLGFIQYEEMLKNTIFNHQIKSENQLINNGFNWNVDDINSNVSFKTTNEVMLPNLKKESFSVIGSSPYMSDELCRAIFAYQQLLKSREGIFQKHIQDKKVLQEELIELEYELLEKENSLFIVQDLLDAFKAEGSLSYEEVLYVGNPQNFSFELKKDYKYVLMGKTSNNVDISLTTPTGIKTFEEADKWEVIEKISYNREVENTVESSIFNYDFNVTVTGDEIIDNPNIIHGGYDTFDELELTDLHVNSMTTKEFSTEHSLSGRSLKTTNSSTQTNGTISFSKAISTDYHQPFEIGKSYIFSIYYYSESDCDIQIVGRMNTGSQFYTNIAHKGSTEWKRYWYQFTPTTATGNLRVDLDTPSVTGYWDNAMLEKAVTGQTRPSKWKPVGESGYIENAKLELQVNRILIEDYDKADNESELLNKFIEDIHQEAYDEQSEIVKLKKNEIANVNTSLETIQNELSVYNNFSPELLAERDLFVITKEYIDEMIANPEELKNRAIEKFEELKNPIVTIEISIVNFLEVLEEHYNWNKLELGTLVNVLYDKFNVMIQAKIIQIDYDFDNKTITLMISNIKDIKTNQEKFIDALYGAISTSTIVSIEKNKWSKATEVKEDFETFVNNAFDATKQKIIAGTNETIEISRRGILIKSDTDPNNFLVANSSVLAITNDAGKTYKNAITTEGVIAQRLIGEIIAGENLIIENEAGSFRVDGEGVTISNQALRIIGGITNEHLSEGLDLKTDLSGVTSIYIDTFIDNNSNTSTPLTPMIIEDGTHVRHTIVTEDLVNIVFNWKYSEEEIFTTDIDGFMIYIYTAPTSATYQFGSKPNNEIRYYVKPNKRSIILYHVPKNLNYTFGIEAYRVVNREINPSGVIKTPVIQMTSSYSPTLTTEYLGDILGVANYGQEVKVTGDVISFIRQGQSYSNVTIDSANGLIAENNLGNQRIIVNEEGFRIQRNEGAGYKDVLYGDNTGRLVAEDLLTKRLIVNDDTGQELINAVTKKINFDNFDLIAGKISGTNINAKGITVLNQWGSPTFSVNDLGEVKVSGNITMASGFISWGNVAAPTYAQVGGTKPPTDANNTKNELQTNATIKGFYLNPTTNALEIWADNITGGKINATLITTGGMSAERITFGTMSGERIQVGTLSAKAIGTDTLSFDFSHGGTLTLGGEPTGEFDENGNALFEHGILVVNFANGKNARLDGEYGGFGELKIDTLLDTKNVVYKIDPTNSRYINNIKDDNTLEFYVDPYYGQDLETTTGSKTDPYKTIQSAIDNLPKYIDVDIYIYFIPSLLQNDTAVNIEGFVGRGSIILQKWSVPIRYIRNSIQGSTVNASNHWVEFDVWRTNGAEIKFTENSLTTNRIEAEKLYPVAQREYVNGIVKGGIATCMFYMNVDYLGNSNQGEIRVVTTFGNRFFHPNGNMYILETGDKEVSTRLEPNQPAQDLYLAFIGTDKTRFTYTYAQNHRDFLPVYYKNGQWYYDNNSTTDMPFTPNANDCLVGLIRKTGDTTSTIGIDSFEEFHHTKYGDIHAFKNIGKMVNDKADTLEYYDGGSKVTWVQAYLGGAYTDIEKVHIWHYFGDGRTYYHNRTEVSEDGVKWYTIYYGGATGEFAETANGQVMYTTKARLNGKIKVMQNIPTVQIKDMYINAKGMGNPAIMSQNTGETLVRDVVVEGDRNYSYAVYAYGGNLRILYSEINYAQLAGIISAYGGKVEVYHCKGAGYPYGHMAHSSGVLGGGGTGLVGDTSNTTLSSGGFISGSWSHTRGVFSPQPAAPPPPPPPTIVTRTKQFTSYHGDAWNDTTGGWHTAEDDVLQGKYSSNLGLYRGCWFFGSDLRNTCVNAKSIISIKIRVTRANSSGSSGGVTHYLKAHGYGSKPSWQPGYHSPTQTFVASRGQTLWIDVTSNFASLFKGGSAYGFGLYTSSTSSSYYSRCSPSAIVEVTYTEEV
jgi:phage minor structural protein